MMKGIYIIKNKLTDECYIGQSKNIQQRWASHRRNLKDGKYSLYSDMRFYGIENFSFEILEETNNLDERENYWIQEYQDRGYNLYNILGVKAKERAYGTRRKNKVFTRKYKP